MCPFLVLRFRAAAPRLILTAATLACATASSAQSVTPTIAVPRLAAAPTVDGVLAEGEWDGASALSAFQHYRTLFAADSETLAYVGYTAEHLCIAFQCVQPGGAAPRAEVRDKDGTTWTDDSVEVFLQPPRTGGYAHLVLSAGGVLADAWGMDLSYESGALTAAHIDGGTWTCELAIPFSALRAPAPQPADVWRGNLCRNVFGGGTGTYTWAPTLGGFHQPAYFGTFAFGAEQPVVRVTSFAPGVTTPWVAGSVRGLPQATARYQCLQGRSVVADLTRDVRDGTLPVVQLPRDPGLYEIVYALTGPDGQRAFEQSIFYEVIPALALRVDKYLLSRRRAYLTLDTRDHPEAVRAEFTLLSRPDGKPVWKVVSQVDVNAHTARAELSTAHLPPDDYDLQALLLDKEDREVGSCRIHFRNPPRPDWYANKLGMSQKVPAPWTPVQRTDKTATVWGRTYSFDNLALPASITSGGVELLAGPVRLMGADGPMAPRPGSAVRSRPAGSDGCEFEGRGQLDDCHARLRTRVEFDGFTRTDLTLSPHGEGLLRRLVLEVPLRRQVATLYWHSILEGYHWSRQDLWPNGGAVSAEGWKGPFTPAVWVGDRERGLQWYARGPIGWRIADRQQAVEVVPEGDAVLMRFHLVDTPVTLQESLTFTWGLMATPVKPIPADWRKERFAANCGYGSEEKLQRTAPKLTLPAEGNLNLERGTLELDVVPMFDPSFEPDPTGLPRGCDNQGLVALHLANGDGMGFYWNIDARSLRFYEVRAGQFPVLFDAPVPLSGWKRHHVGLTWGDETAIWIDGHKVVGAGPRPLCAGDLRGATLELGGGEWIIGNLAIRSEPRDLSTPSPFRPDPSTLLLAPLDEVEGSGDSQTVPLLVGHGRFSVQSLRPLTVSDLAGISGLDLSAATVARSPLEVGASWGLRYGHIHENWSDVQSHPDTIHAAQFASLAKGCREAGVALCPYFSGEFSDRSPLWEDYSAEFLAIPVERVTMPYYRAPRQAVYPGNTATSAYGDFLIAGIVKLIEEYDIGGIYMDGLQYPVWGDNEVMGLGYRDDQGQLHPTYEVFASREFMKRLYRACKERKPNFFFRAHASGGFIAPTMSFCSTYFNGEQLGNFGPDYTLPLDRYWAEFYGRNYGLVADVYPTAVVDDNEALCLDLLHDALPFAWMPNDPGPATQIWRLWDEFGADTATFVPFYRVGDEVRSSVESVKVSYLRGPRGVLLAVANLSPRERAEAVIGLRPAKLGLGAGPLALRRWLGTAATAEDAQVRLTLPPLMWSLVWVSSP